MPNFNSLLLIFMLQANQPFTRVNSVPEMKHPFFGCAEKADLEYLIDLMTRLPRGAGRGDALAYGRAHCIQIPKEVVTVERWEGNLACIRGRSSRRVCVWVPRELIGSSPIDDGVF
jgi:hypothetical protein